MASEKDNWNEYTKLVIKELERLNDNQEKMIKEINQINKESNEINIKLTEIKNHEKSVATTSEWMTKVTDVWSVSQMKEAKDEIYKQKSRWIAAIAIIGFLQILIGYGISIWMKLH